MTFEQLVRRYAEVQHIQRLSDAEERLRGVFGVIAAELTYGNSISIPGFGKFVVKKWPARRMKVLGTFIQVAARNRVRFTPYEKTRRSVR